MATYFTAASDDAAASALATTPVGAEVLTSVIAPHSDSFAALIELIIGTEVWETRGDSFVVCHSVASSDTMRVVRLASDLVAEIADRDVVEFSELAGPWRRTGALDGSGESDLTDFLINLQHLSRNASAEKGGVYAIEAF